MIMGLRPMLWPFGLVGVAGMSAALELIQPIFGRTTDWSGDFVHQLSGGNSGGIGGIDRTIFVVVCKNGGGECGKSEKRRRDLGMGRRFFGKGNRATNFILIRSGQVVLTREANGTTTELAKVGPGEVVGEMGVLQNLARSATATAKGEVLVVCDDGAGLDG